MATIKLGMLVTQIAGSIGGTTFRRFKNGIVMQNKQKGASSNILLQNKKLSQLTSIVKNWSLLSTTLKNSWSAQALNFEFVDKFGDLKNLTGRQLYIKIANYTTNVSLPIPDPATLTSVVDIVTVIDIDIQFLSTFWVKLDLVNTDVIIEFQIELINNISTSPTFTRRKTIYYGTMNAQREISFGNIFWETYPYLKEGQVIRCYYNTINSSGFKSITKTFTATVN